MIVTRSPYLDSVDDASYTILHLWRAVAQCYECYTDRTNTTSHIRLLHHALAHSLSFSALSHASHLSQTLLSIEVDNRPSGDLSPFQLLHRLWQLIDRIDRINGLQKPTFRKVQCSRRIFHAADECTGDGKVLEGEERGIGTNGCRAFRCCMVGSGLVKGRGTVMEGRSGFYEQGR